MVRYRGEISSPFYPTSGVPQGSLLGPILFSLFVNDLQEAVVSSSLLMFADDAKVYKDISVNEDCQSLQDDLERIVRWCQINDMELNGSKCMVITFSRSRNPLRFDYNVRGMVINRSDTVKDLGVLISSTLSPENHISAICKRAHRVMGFIVRTSRDGFSPWALRTLFIQLVRPILEYCSSAWSPYQTGHVEQLERVQTQFIRFVGLILGFSYREVPIEDLRLQLGLLPLSSRREIADLVLLKKLLNSTCDCPDLLARLNIHCSRSIRTPNLFHREFQATLYAYNSPLPRLHRLGNSLSDSIDLFLMTDDQFKRKLNKLYAT